MIYQFPASDLCFVHHKRRIDFWDFFRKILESQAHNVNQISFFQLVGRGVCFLSTNKKLQQ